MSDQVLKYRPNIAKEYLNNKKYYDQLTPLKETKENQILLDGLANLASQVLNYSENGNIYFVGRSLELLYDVISSLLSNLPDHQEKISLLPLSMKEGQPGNFASVGLEEHFIRHHVDPQSIIKRSRKTVLVDVVFMGRTFSNLCEYYYFWAKRLGINPDDLFLKLKIIAIISKENPKEDIQDLEADIANSLDWDDYFEKVKMNHKFFTKIFIDETFWRECADNHDRFKKTESFDDWVMKEYALSLFGYDSDLPEDSIKCSTTGGPNTVIYARFQQPKYREKVIQLMRKGRYHLPELKSESESMSWHRSIVSRIKSKTPIKVHNNHSKDGQVNFRKRPGGKNKKRPEKKTKSLNPKEERILASVLNRVQKIKEKVRNNSDGYVAFKIQELEPQVRNRLVEHNLFIIRRDDTLTIYDMDKFAVEDLKGTYDSFVGIFPHSNQVNPDYQSKKFTELNL